MARTTLLKSFRVQQCKRGTDLADDIVLQFLKENIKMVLKNWNVANLWYSSYTSLLYTPAMGYFLNFHVKIYTITDKTTCEYKFLLI